MRSSFVTDNMHEEIHYPWLLFRLKDNFFAINSRRVTGIMIRPDDLTQLPESPSFVRGLFMLRGSVIRLLDLRLLFSMDSTQSECETFQYMLEEKKQEHILWVEELKRCIFSGEPFTLATDPHQCAFGRWYDSYHSDQANINHHLRKIDEPHARLHHTAITCARLLEQGKDASDPEVTAVIEELENDIVPQIVTLIDEMKRLFINNIREMVIVIEEEDRRLGLIVDQVLSVEDLATEELDDQGVNFFHDLTYVDGVCKCKNVEGDILVINDNQFLTLTAGDGNLDEIHVQSL